MHAMNHNAGRMAILCLLLWTLAGCGAIQSITPGAQREKKVNKHMTDAREFREQGMDDSALAALSLALEENPKLTEAHMQMGDIFRDRGDLDRAEERFKQAATIEPNNYKARYLSGLMQHLMGNIEPAVNTYLQALAIEPEDFDTNRDLASAYLQLGKPDTALPYAKLATRVNPESQPAWSNLAATYSLLGQYDDAIAAYRTANELGELADPVLLGLADAHIRLGNYPRAINTLNSLIVSRRDSEDQTGLSTAHERLGYALFKMRRYEDALEQYQSALEYDVQDVAALNGVGAAYMTLFLEGDRNNLYQRRQAIEAWRRSVQVNPSQPRIVDLLARYG